MNVLSSAEQKGQPLGSQALLNRPRGQFSENKLKSINIQQQIKRIPNNPTTTIKSGIKSEDLRSTQI